MNLNPHLPAVAPPATPPPARAGRRWKWLITMGAPLVAVVLIFTLWNKGQAKPTIEPMIRVPVAVATVTRTNLTSEVVVEAEFRPYQEIDVHAKVAGFLENITVDIGDRVKAGQALATLEVPELHDDLAHAQAGLLRSRDEVNRAAAAYREMHDLYTRLDATAKARPNLIAAQDIDTALAKDQNAVAAWEGAKEQVKEAQTAVDRLNTMLAYTKITAPFTGVITKRYADPGALIQAGTSSSIQAMPLVRLSQNDRLRLVFPVPVSNVSNIREGDVVTIHIDSLGQTFTGKISRFARKVDTDTRTMETEVDVPNPELKLIPGIYAHVALGVEHRDNVLTVPVDAVSGSKSPTVYVVNANNEIEERSIKLGLETPACYEVLSGLKDKERVFIGDRGQVKSGQRVEPQAVQ